MTAFGIALTVAVLVTSLALRSGLDRVFSGTGHPLQFLVLRKGSTAELNSSVSVEAYNLIKELPGIARTPDGTDLISRESITIVNLASREYPDGMNITVRGVSEMGPRLREFSIARGRMFNPGQREVIVGSGVARRYPDAAIGSTIRFGRGLWTVVGVFSTNGSAADSEIWCDLNQLAGDFSSQGSSSILLARAENTAAMESLKKLIEGERRAGADVIFERKYYAEQQSSGQLLQTLGGFVAVVMAVGSAFAATNTMYAAVSRRKREIGTLRALGFTRADILRSFVLESVFLSLLGGILGVLIALPVNNASAGVGSFSTFSEISFQFRIDAPAILTALLFSALIGALGGFLPAWSASKMNIIQAMRDA
jgi:ABC-type antimicrobial peptide transport system permease subunit